MLSMKNVFDPVFDKSILKSCSFSEFQKFKNDHASLVIIYAAIALFETTEIWVSKYCESFCAVLCVLDFL